MLRGITWDHPRGYAPLAAAASACHEKQPDVGLEWDRRPLRAFGEASIDELVARYDLIVIDHPFVGTAAAAGLIVPLESELPQEVLDRLAHESVGPSYASYAYGGHQWALPIDASGQASARRPDLLERLALPAPRTWDEVLGLARRTGAVAVPFAPIDALSSFFTLCALGGEEPCRSPIRVVAEEVGIQALEDLQALINVVDPVCFDRNPIAVLDAMSNDDRIAYVPITYAYSNHARDGFGAHLLFFDKVPGSEDGGVTLGGAGLAVSAASAHRADAVAFAAWIAGEGPQRTLYVEAGGQPANRVAWEDDRANELTHGFFRSLLPTFDRAYMRPNRPGFAAFQSQAAPLVRRALVERLPPAETLAGLERAYARTRVGSEAADVEQ